LDAVELAAFLIKGGISHLGSCKRALARLLLEAGGVAKREAGDDKA
jgi:hypothetical protein